MHLRIQGPRTLQADAKDISRKGASGVGGSLSQLENRLLASGESTGSSGCSGPLSGTSPAAQGEHVVLPAFGELHVPVVTPPHYLRFGWKSGVMRVQRKHWLKLQPRSPILTDLKTSYVPPELSRTFYQWEMFSLSGIRANKEVECLKSPTTNKSQSIKYRRDM